MFEKLKVHDGDTPGKVLEVKLEYPKPKVETMSKDIWHKPSETTDVDNNLIIDDWTNGTYELGYFDDKDMIFRNLRNDDTYFEESMMRWCDVDDLVHDYNCTRKALEIAVDLLKLIYQGNGDPQDIMRYKDNRWTSVRRLCKEALEQITALEQKDVK